MKNKQRCGKKDAPTGCGSREGQGCTVRKHPSVHVKHSRCCNKKKKTDDKQTAEGGKLEEEEEISS